MAKTITTRTTSEKSQGPRSSEDGNEGGNAGGNAGERALLASLSSSGIVTPASGIATNGIANSAVVASTRGGVRFPGLPLFPLGVERYSISGGCALALEVFPNDEITLLDEEGMQACSIASFPLQKSGSLKDSRSDLGLLGAGNLAKGKNSNGKSGGDARGDTRGETKGETKGETLGSLLDSDAAKDLRAKLRTRGCDLGQKTRQIFDAYGRPGAQHHFSAQAASLLIVCAERQKHMFESMALEGSTGDGLANPPSKIMLYVKRAPRSVNGDGLASNKQEQGITLPLPSHPPLAEPLQEFVLQPGEAKAYVVKKGEFVQIQDIRGRECSDFQAYDLRALDKQIFRDIDPTTTRSLMGNLYPHPGLFSKYFTLDQKPLIEIVQDTVGRHDSFNLACTSRYYEDAGYFGHVNCSDNLNAQGRAYDISYRAGWPAINFFFNTMLESDYCLICDEPWSRPGDYVLLRALEDAVCFSTACPCDIDAANGWHPTEVQVRVYGKNCFFPQGLGVRMTTQSDASLTRQTAFHANFAKRTRNFTEYNGYWLAQDYTNLGAIAEYWACREKSIVTDLSPLRKYEVLGPDAAALMQWSVTRDISKLAVGQVVYSAMCYENGGMIDDGTVLRLDEHNFRWIGGCDNSGLWLKEQAAKKGLDVWVKNSTEQIHNIAVQGPNSRELLKSLFWTSQQHPSVEELGWFRFSIARLGDFQGVPVLISRTGYTGELGYEIFCHPRDASSVFDAVWAAGEGQGLQPLGLEALDLLRIEAGLIFAGSEFCDRTDPFEAGIGFTVPLKSKQDDFCGREALQRRKDSPRQRLVGLEIASNTVPSGGDCIRQGRAQIGEITSAMRSPILSKTIALARLDIEYASDGTEVEIGQLDGQQKRIPATVVPFPFYDPKKERVRA